MRRAELEVDVIRSSTLKAHALIFVLAAVCAITASYPLIQGWQGAGLIGEYSNYLFLAAAVLVGVGYWQFRSQQRRLSLYRKEGVHTLEVAGSIAKEGPFDLRFGYADYRLAGYRSPRVRELVLCIDKDERTICTLEENGNPDHDPPRGWPEGWPEPNGGPRFNVAGPRPIVAELRRRLDAGAVDDEDAIADDAITEDDVAALVEMFNKRD